MWVVHTRNRNPSLPKIYEHVKKDGTGVGAFETRRKGSVELEVTTQAAHSGTNGMRLHFRDYYYTKENWIGRCWCEESDSSTCTKETSTVLFDRYDFTTSTVELSGRSSYYLTASKKTTLRADTPRLKINAK